MVVTGISEKIVTYIRRTERLEESANAASTLPIFIPSDEKTVL